MKRRRTKNPSPAIHANDKSCCVRFGAVVERFADRIKKSYKNSCPKLYGVCYDPLGTHRRTRAIIGFLLGFLLGSLFYKLIILGLAFDPHTSLSLGAILVGILAIGCASSVQIRCICILTIPGLCGRAGRGVLKAVVLAHVIAGPIFNLIYNGKEVVRTVSCTTELTYNLTKTRFDLMYEPFQKAILGIKADANEIKDTLSSVRDLAAPIVGEIEGEDEMRKLKESNDYADEQLGDTKRSEEIAEREKILETSSNRSNDEAEKYQTRYREKIQARCEDQLNKGSDRCRMLFSDAYNRCYDQVTWVVAWLLCWPMKLTFVCNIAQAMGGGSVCDPTGKIDVGIGEQYAALKGSRDQLSSRLKDARLQYKVLKSSGEVVQIRRAGEAARAVLYEFEIRSRLLESLLRMIQHCLAFVFITVIINAQRYHDRYLTDIEFDNVYVTGYFRRIDARRRFRDSKTLMPLRKLERSKLVNPWTPRPSDIEKSNLLGQSVKLILEMITISSLVILDRLFYETLAIVGGHGRVDFTQIGEHDARVEIRGSGPVANLVRSVLRGFNYRGRVKTKTSNEPCLPRPRRVTDQTILRIYGTYLAAWATLFVAAYASRSRRLVCAFFYRKREKRRILYLYNETMRRRAGYLRFARARARNLARRKLLENDDSMWKAMRTRWPKLCGWLGWFCATGRERCLVCAEIEPRCGGAKFQKCPTPGCEFFHCPECWRDVEEICYACAEPGNDTDDDDDDDYRDVI